MLAAAVTHTGRSYVWGWHRGPHQGKAGRGTHPSHLIASSKQALPTTDCTVRSVRSPDSSLLLRLDSHVTLSLKTQALQSIESSCHALGGEGAAERAQGTFRAVNLLCPSCSGV